MENSITFLYKQVNLSIEEFMSFIDVKKNPELFNPAFNLGYAITKAVDSAKKQYADEINSAGISTLTIALELSDDEMLDVIQSGLAVKFQNNIPTSIQTALDQYVKPN